MLRLFNRGHLEEKRFVQYLRSVGVEVWEAGESGDLKTLMRYSDHEGHFGGTPDGVGRAFQEIPNNEPAVLEFKTHNAKSFDKLVNDGLVGTKYSHFIQMQVSMHKMHINWGVYCAVNKDTDALHMEIIQYSKLEPTRALEKAGRVIRSPAPLQRIANTPASMACKFCQFQRLCHFGDVSPDYNCRTCLHSRVASGGLFLCDKHGTVLTEQNQRDACSNYKANPLLSGRQP